MKEYGEVCIDNRFELIKKYKERLIEATNIETSKDEMAVIDNILFRFWQMGWLDKLEADVVEGQYKRLYEQLLDDFKHALYYAEKNANVCNFCEHDCGEGGTCKGQEDRINCSPIWRGIRESKADGE